jgi:hypothetical protein
MFWACASLLPVRGKAALLALCTAASLAYGAAASAVAVERIPLQTRPETAGFPPGVFLTLVSPAQYAAQAPGRWVGPEYWASGDPSLRGNSTIEWSVTLRDRSVEPDAAAAAATQRGWREQERGGIAVPHVLGKTVLGTLPSYFVLKFREAMHETALAIPLGPTAIAIVKFSLSAPATNGEPGLGNNLVLGSFGASTWNRGQAFLALSGVHLEGNLPPSLVTLRQVRPKRILGGAVLDDFKHPVVGVRAVLERRSGASWRASASAKTNGQGSFTFRASPGRYRVSVTVAGKTLYSGSIPVA